MLLGRSFFLLSENCPESPSVSDLYADPYCTVIVRDGLEVVKKYVQLQQ